MNYLDDPNIAKFITEHKIEIVDIRSQPFLDNDIYYEKKEKGWEILIYPRVNLTDVGYYLILVALSSILRRTKPWYSFPESKRFQTDVYNYLSKNLKPASFWQEVFANEFWGIGNCFHYAFELKFLVDNEYLFLYDLRKLTSYLSKNFVTVKVAAEFLASMAVLRLSGGDVSFLYEEIIANKRYDMLKTVDTFEHALNNNGFEYEHVKRVFDEFFPELQQDERAIEQMAKISEKVLGPRNEANIDYDIALSFAGEDRVIAEKIAESLLQNGVKVFYDKYEQANLWGKDLYSHLNDVYSKRARYCVILISKNYAKKQWTNHERKAAQSKALMENREYILPLRLDDTEISGLAPTIGYVDLRNISLEDVVHLLLQKLNS